MKKNELRHQFHPFKGLPLLNAHLNSINLALTTPNLNILKRICQHLMGFIATTISIMIFLSVQIDQKNKNLGTSESTTNNKVS